MYRNTEVVEAIAYLIILGMSSSLICVFSYSFSQTSLLIESG
jgi:hypothetical protein